MAKQRRASSRPRPVEANDIDFSHFGASIGDPGRPRGLEPGRNADRDAKNLLGPATSRPLHSTSRAWPRSRRTTTLARHPCCGPSCPGIRRKRSSTSGSGCISTCATAIWRRVPPRRRRRRSACLPQPSPSTRAITTRRSSIFARRARKRPTTITPCTCSHRCSRSAMRWTRPFPILLRAIELNPENRAMARHDPDLEPLRQYDSVRAALERIQLREGRAPQSPRRSR